jgi:hypothetical protein
MDDNKFKIAEQQNEPSVVRTVPRVDEQVQEMQKALRDLKEQVQKDRTDFVTLVSLFAGVITFLTVEFQFLKTVCSGERIIGFSMLLWSLLFSLNITLMFLLDNSQGELFLQKAKRYWLLVVFIAINFCGGIFFIIRSNEEIARENKIYEKFSQEFRQELDELKKRIIPIGK